MPFAKTEIDVDCYQCGSGEGEPCRTPSGEAAKRFHLRRKDRLSRVEWNTYGRPINSAGIAVKIALFPWLTKGKQLDFETLNALVK